MTRLYVRWSVILVAGIVLAALASQYHARHLAALTPETVVATSPTGTAIRVIGMVQGGTLEGEVATGSLRFQLGGAHDVLPVQYQGPPPENLRELKTLVVIGRWIPETRTFVAHDLGLVANYGFVMAAYLAALIPLGLFVFGMERRVSLLYRDIKESKIYEPEASVHVDGT